MSGTLLQCATASLPEQRGDAATSGVFRGGAGPISPAEDLPYPEEPPSRNSRLRMG